MKFQSKFIHFNSRKCIWKCRLANGGHFVSASRQSGRYPILTTDHHCNRHIFTDTLWNWNQQHWPYTIFDGAFQQRAHYTFRGWLWTHQQITHCTRVDISSSGACVPTRSGSNGQEPVWGISMMTSSNGNIFRVTGPLCGNSPVPVNSPHKGPVTRSYDVFFDLRLNKRLSKQPWGWWFETPSWSLWRQCNESGCLERYTAATKHLWIAWTKAQESSLSDQLHPESGYCEKTLSPHDTKGTVFFWCDHLQ